MGNWDQRRDTACSHQRMDTMTWHELRAYLQPVDRPERDYFIKMNTIGMEREIQKDAETALPCVSDISAHAV